MPLDAVRLRFFGGTTNRWGGQSSPLEPLDFARRDWVGESGWPIPYKELAPYLERAITICQLDVDRFDWAYWQQQPGVSASPLDPQRWSPVVFGYRLAGPLRFGSAYRDDVASADNLSCFLHANVVGLRANEPGSQIEEVEIRTPDGRPGACVRPGDGRHRDLSAATAGEGRRQRLRQGRLLFHGTSQLRYAEIRFGSEEDAAFLVEPNRLEKLRLDFHMTPERQAELQILNPSVFMLPSGNASQQAGDLGLLTRMWDRVERLTERAYQRLSGTRTFKLRVRLEHAPHADSRVTLSERRNRFGQPHANVHLAFGPLEEKTIETVVNETAREIGRTGLGRLRSTSDLKAIPWQQQVGWQYHHCGGARMSTDPSRGVVDPTCRVHGTANLYVAGRAVFPTAGHANPTMNLVAMTLRLSDHLTQTLVP